MKPMVTVNDQNIKVSVDVPYPGTRGDVTVSVGYQRVSAKRQSDRVEMTLTLFNSSAGPVMGEMTFEGLPVGDFIVTVRAENKFGVSTSSQSDVFTVKREGTYTKSCMDSVRSSVYNFESLFLPFLFTFVQQL